MEESGKPESEIDMEDVMDGLQKKARDHSRVPMQVGLICLEQPPCPHLGIIASAPLACFDFSPHHSLDWLFSVELLHQRRLHDRYTMDACQRRL
jgi:hypothetical protein